MIILTIFGVLLLADAWTTYRALKIGGSEGTGGVKWLMDLVGVVPALLLLSAALMGVMYFGYTIDPFVVVPAIIWRASVVYHNLKVIKILKARM